MNSMMKKNTNRWHPQSINQTDRDDLSYPKIMNRTRKFHRGPRCRRHRILVSFNATQRSARQTRMLYTQGWGFAGLKHNFHELEQLLLNHENHQHGEQTRPFSEFLKWQRKIFLKIVTQLSSNDRQKLHGKNLGKNFSKTSLKKCTNWNKINSSMSHQKNFFGFLEDEHSEEKRYTSIRRSSFGVFGSIML